MQEVPMPEKPDEHANLGGDYARDTHEGGYGDNYARDDEEKIEENAESDEIRIGKTSE
jgi:hypothetical protein